MPGVQATGPQPKEVGCWLLPVAKLSRAESEAMGLIETIIADSAKLEVSTCRCVYRPAVLEHVAFGRPKPLKLSKMRNRRPRLSAGIGGCAEMGHFDRPQGTSCFHAPGSPHLAVLGRYEKFVAETTENIKAG